MIFASSKNCRIEVSPANCLINSIYIFLIAGLDTDSSITSPPNSSYQNLSSSVKIPLSSLADDDDDDDDDDDNGNGNDNDADDDGESSSLRDNGDGDRDRDAAGDRDCERDFERLLLFLLAGAGNAM